MKLSHFFNGEGIELFHMPDATTDGDSIVHFRGSDVISAGDIFDMTSFPFIDMAKGGSIQGVLAALNRMDDMAEAEFRYRRRHTVYSGPWAGCRPGGYRLLPGYGDYHPGPGSMDDEEGYVAGADQSGQADRRLGRAIWQESKLDAGYVCRGDIQGTQWKEVSTRR